MSQHFLLSPAAKTLSLVKVMRMSDEEARASFRKIRWSETNGEPICPECGSCEAYDVNFRAKLTRDLHRELTHQRVMFWGSGWGQGMCDLLLFPGCCG